MRIVSRYSSFGLLILAVSAFGQSQEPLTWQECVRLANLRNPDIMSAANAQETSRAQYYGSYNGILPKATLNNTYSDSKNSGGLGASESKVWTLGGNASLDLVDVSQWANIRSASGALQQSQANYRTARATALMNLYKGFASLLYAQEEVGVYTSIRDTWKMNADMVSLRYKSGNESKGNMMNTQAQLLQSDVNLGQSARDIQVAQQQLGQVLGMDEFTTLVVTGTWSAAPAPKPHPEFPGILASVPQIQAQEAVVEQARAGIQSAHSSLWPTLSFNYSQGVQGTTEFPHDNPYWAFLGVLSYPLFSGGLTSTYYASLAAQHAFEKAQQDLRSLRNQTLTSLESAWSAYAMAEDQIHVQQAFLEADRQRKSEADILYQSGLMTFQDWILIVNDYVNFQVSVLRAEQNLVLAEAQWRFTIGEQLGD